MAAIIKTFCDDYDNCNTYLYIKNETAIIIDPANDVKQILKSAENVKIVGIFITHGHYDHFKNLSEIMSKTDCPVYLSKKAYEKLFNKDTSCASYFTNNFVCEYDEKRFAFVSDGQKIMVANDFEVLIWQTKGHTDCGICLFIDDNIFTGDTLFCKGVGRSNLPTSNTIQLIASIKRLMDLKKDYNVYPGHDKMTTIFDEQKNNPFYNRIK